MFDKILLFCYDSLYEHPVGGYMWASIQTPCTKKSGNGEGEERVVKREGAEQWSKQFLRIFGPETFNYDRAKLGFTKLRGARFCFFAAPANFLKTWH